MRRKGSHFHLAAEPNDDLPHCAQPSGSGVEFVLPSGELPISPAELDALELLLGAELRSLFYN